MKMDSQKQTRKKRKNIYKNIEKKHKKTKILCKKHKKTNVESTVFFELLILNSQRPSEYEILQFYVELFVSIKPKRIPSSLSNYFMRIWNTLIYVELYVSTRPYNFRRNISFSFILNIINCISELVSPFDFRRHQALRIPHAYPIT